MDGDWGNIVYLILMVLFVIVGALKKKKKAVGNIEGAEAERSEDDAPVGIENLFDTILGANTFAPQVKHPYQVVEEEFVDNKLEMNLFTKEEIDSVKQDKPKQVVVEDLNDDEVYIEEYEEFDWRQAIISKEILDRKYI
ncbi:hypothetical protein ACXR6G_03385 [Ancylomarina sp. YFZ004]